MTPAYDIFSVIISNLEKFCSTRKKEYCRNIYLNIVVVTIVIKFKEREIKMSALNFTPLVKIKSTPTLKYWKVGGCVRDTLMGLVPNDIDLVVEGATNVQEVVQDLQQSGATIYLVREEFLTIRCNHSQFGPVDVVLCRGEGSYSDGRRPSEVHPVKDLHVDLSRRDFTINAMAQDLVTGEIVDLFGGREDLKKKCLRAVGNPSERFAEDVLRILRAVRFVVRFDMVIEPITKAAAIEFAPRITSLPVERIRQELGKSFLVSPLKTWSVLQELSLLELLFGATKPLMTLTLGIAPQKIFIDKVIAVCTTLFLPPSSITIIVNYLF